MTEDNPYDVRMRVELMIPESVSTLARYAGILMGVAGIVNERVGEGDPILDSILIGSGAAFYLSARWASVSFQDGIDERRFKTLERRLKG